MLEIRVSDTLAIPSFANRLGDVTLDGALGAATQAETLTGAAVDKWINPLRLKQRLREDGVINVKVLGAKGDFVTTTQVGTDDKQAFLDAIDEAKDLIASGQPERAHIIVPPGNYRLTEQLDLDDFGMWLIGRGNTASRLYFDHADIGARFYRSESGAKDIGFYATTARIAEAYGVVKAGVMVLGAAGATVNSAIDFERCVFSDQPGPGLLHTGSGAKIVSCQARLNKGHGICLDTGRILIGSALIVEGDITFHGLNDVVRPICVGNGGHGLVIGHPDDTSTKQCFRNSVRQIDSSANATDAAVRYTTDDSFLYGVGIEVALCGISAPAGAGQFTLAGISIEVRKQRVIGDGAYVAKVIKYAGFATDAVSVDIDTVVSPLAPLDPAVVIDASVATTSEVNVSAQSSANITTLKTPGWPGVERFGNVHTYRGGRSTFDSIGNQSTGSIFDDAVKTLEFSSELTGMALIWAETSPGRAALIYFHVGATSPFCILQAAAFGVVTGTGVLAGTTATFPGGGDIADGDLAISAHTDNKLYIQNRTGSTRTYHIVLFSALSSARITAVA